MFIHVYTCSTQDLAWQIWRLWERLELYLKLSSVDLNTAWLHSMDLNDWPTGRSVRFKGKCENEMCQV